MKNLLRNSSMQFHWDCPRGLAIQTRYVYFLLAKLDDSKILQKSWSEFVKNSSWNCGRKAAKFCLIFFFSLGIIQRYRDLGSSMYFIIMFWGFSEALLTSHLGSSHITYLLQTTDAQWKKCELLSQKYLCICRQLPSVGQKH